MIGDVSIISDISDNSKRYLQIREVHSCNPVVHCESDDSLIFDLSDQAEVFLFIIRRK
jgi:hypothetical protein